MGPLHNVHEQWLSISKFSQWMSEQKDFHCGAAECEHTQWNAWRLACQGFPNHMQPNYTTCQNTRVSTQCSADAKFHDLFPLARLYKTDLKNHPQNHNARVSCKPPLYWSWVRVSCMPTPWESHTGRSNVWLLLSDKNPINLRLVLSIPHRADREGTTHNNLPSADQSKLHFLLETLSAVLNCLLCIIELGYWDWLWKYYTAVSYGDTLDTPKWVV